MLIEVVIVTILVLFSISKAVTGQVDLLSPFQCKDLDFPHDIFFLAKAGTHSLLEQGSPTPGPWTCASLWPVRNQAVQQEVSSG